MIRAVIDLNVLVSAFILARGIPYETLRAWQRELFVLVCSEGMLVELEGKLHAPKLAAYQLAVREITAFLALLRTQAEVILVPEDQIRPVTVDPEDNLVLATGRLARADYLVTGDKRLPRLGRYEGVQIVTPRDFLDLLQEQESSDL